MAFTLSPQSGQSSRLSRKDHFPSATATNATNSNGPSTWIVSAIFLRPDPLGFFPPACIVSARGRFDIFVRGLSHSPLRQTHLSSIPKSKSIQQEIHPLCIFVLGTQLLYFLANIPIRFWLFGTHKPFQKCTNIGLDCQVAVRESFFSIDSLPPFSPFNFQSVQKVVWIARLLSDYPCSQVTRYHLLPVQTSFQGSTDVNL